MIHFIKRYYIFLLVIVVLIGIFSYQALSVIFIAYQDKYDPYYNPLIGGSASVSVFMGSIGDRGKCDNLNQVKRGAPPENQLDTAIRKLFEGPVYSEELILESAFKGYDKIYNGVKVVQGNAYVDFKGEIIDPNSSYFKDFTKPCIIAQLNQLYFTVKQFKEIQNVIIAVDGSPKKFMQSRQVNCDLLENQVKFEKECLTKIP
jgi:hypothetical protein